MLQVKCWTKNGESPLALPKSIEHYYQEAGRAGRDGEPATCFLLWRGSDLGLLGHFAAESGDHLVREKAWDQFKSIKKYAVSERCRQREICEHFGETPKWEKCENCDLCAGEYVWIAGSAPSARYLESSATREALRLIREGKALEEIARARNVQLATIQDMTGELVENGTLEFQAGWLERDRLQQIEGAARAMGLDFLKPIKEFLPEGFAYGEIKLVVGWLRRNSGWERKRAA